MFSVTYRKVSVNFEIFLYHKTRIINYTVIIQSVNKKFILLPSCSVYIFTWWIFIWNKNYYAIEEIIYKDGKRNNNDVAFNKFCKVFTFYWEGFWNHLKVKQKLL